MFTRRHVLGTIALCLPLLSFFILFDFILFWHVLRWASRPGRAALLINQLVLSNKAWQQLQVEYKIIRVLN